MKTLVGFSDAATWRGSPGRSAATNRAPDRFGEKKRSAPLEAGKSSACLKPIRRTVRGRAAPTALLPG